jgi:hypothetical protein
MLNNLKEENTIYSIRKIKNKNKQWCGSFTVFAEISHVKLIYDLKKVTNISIFVPIRFEFGSGPQCLGPDPTKKVQIR